MSKTFRILFLGAGFSRPAGLPLGSELFEQIRGDLRSRHGADNPLERDLHRYIKYLSDCEGKSVDPRSIDYELFMGFLDVEHFLGLKGSDTWSDEGNESQLMIKQAIARILYERTPQQPSDLYRQFAGRLNTSDTVFTFNYDTLLESALDAEGIPYRLFPDRYKEIGWGYNTTDDSKDELVLIKLHGSIDWFDRAIYEKQVKYAVSHPTPYKVKHPVFGEGRIVDSRPLTDGPREVDDPLTKVYRVANPGPLFECGFWECCPLILAPSQTKIYYSQPLRGFWWGLQRVGAFNLGLGVVGYSLPSYDEYARQALYYVFSNYTEHGADHELNGRKKSHPRILDYPLNGDSGTDIRSRYRFANWKRAEFLLQGLDMSSLDWLLA